MKENRTLPEDLISLAGNILGNLLIKVELQFVIQTLAFFAAAKKHLESHRKLLKPPHSFLLDLFRSQRLHRVQA